jgi:hypothetical protein
VPWAGSGEAARATPASMLIRTMIAAPVADGDRYILLGRAAHGSLVTDGALAKADLQLDLAASGATVGHPPPVVARGIPQPKKGKAGTTISCLHLIRDATADQAARVRAGRDISCDVCYSRACARIHKRAMTSVAAWRPTLDRRCGCLDPRGGRLRSTSTWNGVARGLVGPAPPPSDASLEQPADAQPRTHPAPPPRLGLVELPECPACILFAPSTTPQGLVRSV